MAARFFLLLLSTLCLLSASYFATEAWLLNSGKPENVRRATRWMPWSVEAWRLMPQVDPTRANRSNRSRTQKRRLVEQAEGVS